MLDGIIRYSLRYRFLVLIMSLVLLVYGSYLATQMPIDVFPDLDRPRVIILTECPGLATEEVESLVTQPIEIAMLGANGVEAVRSQSTAGLTVIYIEFGWEMNVRQARQIVQERLTYLAGTLPSDIHPLMTPPSSIMGQVVIAGMYRQLGPEGGRLVPLKDPSLIAELFQSENQSSRLNVWKVVDRHVPHSWIRVPFTTLTADSETPQPATDAQRDFTIDIENNLYTVQIPDPAQQQIELGTLGDWVIRPRLLKVNGVAEAFLQGGGRKQYQILIDPTALIEYGVTLNDVKRVVSESNVNTSGGYAITGESERSIRILGRVGPSAATVIEDLESVPVKSLGDRSVLLGQLATITEGAQVKRGDGAINGQPGLVITVVKQPNVDTRQLTQQVAIALREVESSLPADIVMNTELFRLRDTIDRGVFNVAEALVLGGLMVIIVLFLILLNFRTTFITLTAIPVSLVITTLAFRLIGYFTDTTLTINVMTLGGIAVAMGELVDDAIVDVENIFRRLRENQTRQQPRPAILVVYDASREVRSAIVFGTIVVILVFLPLFAIPGVAGRLFEPLAVAYIVSILSSLLVSLTLTPVLSYYLLPLAHITKRTRDSWFLRVLKRGGESLIRLSIAYPAPLLLFTWVVVLIAGVQLMNLGGGFLPAFDEGNIQVNLTLPPGSSLRASNDIASVVDAKFQSMQQTADNPQGEIRHFVRRTGRAELDEHAEPVNATEYILSLNPDRLISRQDMLTKLLAELKEDIPGVSIEVDQPLMHLISHMVSGVKAQIAVKIYGDDLDTLEKLAVESKAILDRIDGLTDPVIEPIRQTDELHIALRKHDLALFGLTRAYVAGILQTALQGEVVSEVLDGQKRFDLLLRLEEQYRTDYANLQRLRIDLPGGKGQIELKDIADVKTGSGPNAINRENARRRMVIRCNTIDRDLTSSVKEIQSRLGTELTLPTGYFIEYGGQFESQQKATRMILILSSVAVLGMFVVLMILLPSVRMVLQILNALPTAFIGGVAAIVITQQDLTVASLVGFISLGGIAVRNGVLLVTHYIHLMKYENEEFTAQLVLRGSLERLSPVLMTALTAGIALVPLVLGGHAPGREILYPVATVIMGGLVTSTFCEFLIHPGIFWRFSGRDAEKIASKDDEHLIL
ncbi:MAG: efflux RND transporter permease subunit [Planctomycetota bacterium]|nr:efflux RND transporter permease subunit [Planctomycetota bacterium]